MSTMLDQIVSTAVFAARLLERAVHDAGPWTITVGDQVVAADRVLLPNGVQFTAQIKPTEATIAVLSCDGEDLSFRIVEPTDYASVLQWVLAVPEPVASR